MGMMKSHLAALEALVELHHQRSAASPRYPGLQWEIAIFNQPGHSHPVQLCKRKRGDSSHNGIKDRKEEKGRHRSQRDKRAVEKDSLIKRWRSMLAAILHVVEIMRKISYLRIVQLQSYACTWTLGSLWDQAETWRTIHDPQHSVTVNPQVGFSQPRYVLKYLKKKKQNQVETTVASNEQQLLVLQLTCSMSSSILLSLFLPLLTSVGRKFLLWWCGNGTSSLKLGAASKSSHISCVPLWNIFASSKLAGRFQRAEFSPCRWEGSQDLEMTF